MIISKKYIIIGGILFGLVYLFFLNKFLATGKKENQILFNSSLNAKITFVYSSSGGESFKLDNSNHEFKISPIMSYLNNSEYFYGTAEIGDSVSKRSYSDTLTLIKQSGVVYRYTFKIFYLR
jgi:hypothetical protein